MDSSLVSIIIPAWGRAMQLKACISSILLSDYLNLEIVVVDCKREGKYATSELHFQEERLLICRSEQLLSIAAARNIGYANCHGNLVLFLDSDNVVDTYMISKLAEVIMSDEHIAFIGPLMYFLSKPDSVWNSGTRKSKIMRRHLMNNIPQRPGFEHSIYDADIIPNAFMTKRSVLDRIGVFDDINFSIQEEETEIQWRARKKGYRTVIRPDAKTYHDIDEVGDPHINSRVLYEIFRSRIVVEKLHSRINVVGIGFFSIFYVVYYLVVVYPRLRKKSEKPFRWLLSCINGTIVGLLKPPVLPPRLKQMES